LAAPWSNALAAATRDTFGGGFGARFRDAAARVDVFRSGELFRCAGRFRTVLRVAKTKPSRCSVGKPRTKHPPTTSAAVASVFDGGESETGRSAGVAAVIHGAATRPPIRPVTNLTKLRAADEEDHEDQSRAA
jgi:hypothetical protein